MTNYKEILRQESLRFNNSQIAGSLGISRQTVVTILKLSKQAGLDYEKTKSMTNRELACLLYPPSSDKPLYKVPDCQKIHREMVKAGVTLQLLWTEYCDECRSAHEIPYQLTQFKKHYRDFLLTTKATMHIEHVPGDVIEVDWAGTTASFVDRESSEPVDVFVFVAVLPYSGYAYAEGFTDQKQEAWTVAHINAFAYFGGVGKKLVPDNLKTGVVKNTRSEMILNKAYQDLAEHYGTAIMPTRIRRPRDKCSVESAVNGVTSFILASIRNQRFFSLYELNDAIMGRLHEFNHKPFQKKTGSRATAFAEESPFLIPLPTERFETAEWKSATVQFDYHVAVDGQHYSVPHEYIKHIVDVRVTPMAVEVFYDGTRICSHPRLHGKPGQYRTIEDHMPPNHRNYAPWDRERFRKWAAQIGSNAVVVVDAIFAGHKAEQQGYRSCMALLKLADKYTPARLDSACAKALSFTSRPSFKGVKAILVSGRDIVTDEAPPMLNTARFSFTRGADYYGRGHE